MSQKDILSRMIAPKSNLTLIVGRLKEKKFVNVNRALHDKREYSISITNSAQSMLQDLNQGMNQLLRATLPLNEIEAQTLNALLDKIRTPNL
jgi:DNA-binding MarR family transcriptional regulator